MALFSVEIYNTPFLSRPKKDPWVEITPNLEQFWALETIGITDSPHVSEDDLALQHFTDTVKVDNDRYHVAWPWRTDAEHNLPENFQLAYGRFQSLSRKFNTNPTLLEKYSAVIKDQEEKGIIEKVRPETTCGHTKHYIPRQAVITPLKTTTKIRIVYDASAKATKTSPSLNDCLYRGPVLLPDLVGLLIRFRLYNIAITADIEKAFLQVALQEPDRDVTRFLWYKVPTTPKPKKNLQVYRFTRVPFGMVSSPFLLGASIDHLMSKIGTTTAKLIQRNIYVDNVIVGAKNLDQAKEIYRESKDSFQSASMNLREWISNEPSFNEFLPSEDKAKPTNFKVLGLCWNTVTDTLAVLSLKDEEPGTEITTKRHVLKLIAQLYDPLGFFSPVTITGKQFLQKLWHEKMDWDDPLTEEQKSAWSVCYPELLKITSVPIQRKTCGDSDVSNVLVCFCDASPQSYAIALYLRTEGITDVTSNLIFAKSRLRPKKEMTIPRMELLAAVIGANALKFVHANLHQPIQRKYLFTDSQCVLGWKGSEKKLSTFVQNRVTKIREQKDIRFRYVKTEHNPADLATRGKAIEDLPAFWWNGPEWVLGPIAEWPTRNTNEISEESYRIMQTEEQVMYEASLVCYETTHPFNLEITEFSSISKLHRVTAWCLRFIQKCRNRSALYEPVLSTEELAAAKLLWEKHIQQESYAEHRKLLTKRKSNQLISQFGLYLDPTSSLIRCSGRLLNATLTVDTKNPKLLPSNHPYTTLVIRSYHKRLNHAGISRTLGQLRFECWIPKGRSVVRTALNKCPPVKQTTPFLMVGLDYFGPLYVKKKHEVVRVWTCLFTCLTVRAIHLEVIRDLTTEQFLMCFSRFVARRGRPSQIISDNAPQFKLAKTITDRLWQGIITSSSTKEYFTENQIKWTFIVELAPWMGGFYERLIGNVKGSLRKSIGTLGLIYGQLNTVLSKVEYIVNCRPLVYVGDDIQSGQSLTPACFLCLNPRQGFPDVPAEECTDPCYNPQRSNANTILQIWKQGQQHLSPFWKSWIVDYLLSLRERGTIKVDQPRIVSTHGPSFGQVVLMKQPLFPRGLWKLVRIEKLNRSADGQIRSAVVRTSEGKSYTRSISMLYPLECTADEQKVKSHVAPRFIQYGPLPINHY